MSSSYTIHGVKVEFPCKAYPSQVSMMEKILKSIDKSQNCLIESPTGSGKSLALICSALAWQREFEKYSSCGDSPKKELLCSCLCHDKSRLKIEDSYPIEKNSRNSNMKMFKVDENVDSYEDFKNETIKFNKPTVDVDKKRSKLKNLEKPQRIEYFDDDDYDDISKIKDRLEEAEEDDEPACDDCDCGESVWDTKTINKVNIPKIYFGTRTHKQISQIIRELGKTVYADVSMTILSSREHTCINAEVVQSRNKNEECKNRLDASACRFNDKVKKYFNHSQMKCHGLTRAWDIEDLVTYGHQIKGCPYFGARELRDTSDIIFCPYNYLIDPLIRKSMEISLKGNIVILDEAHNIEDSSREAASFQLSSDQLDEAIKDINIMTSRHRCEKLEEHLKLRELCEQLNEIIGRNQSSLDGFEGGSRVWKGEDMVALLQLVSLNPEMIKIYEKSFRKVMESSNVDDDTKKHPRRMKEQKDKLSSSTTSLLEGVLTVMSFIYKQEKKHLHDYRIALTRVMSYGRKEADNRWMNKKRYSKSNSSWNFQLNFWCMNSAVAFTEMSKGVRSIILTSGTLSPMSSFQSELDVPFQIQFEANHVINSNQVLVSCLSHGPSRTGLLGSFMNSERWDYQDEVGTIIYDICFVVPHGVLCFLPSYKSLEKLTTRWQTTGLWSRLEKLKLIHVEPRAGAKENFDDVIRSYYEAVDSTIHASIGGPTGALFLAICRGKVSEGIDFADDYARAVILVSIPYPNIKDAQINLKKEYNDLKMSKGLLSGREWYDIQAFRALNQALGRCIRHKNDWGAIILVDDRYKKNQQKHVSYLSKWLRQKVKFHDNYHLAHRCLEKFIHERSADVMSSNHPHVAVSCDSSMLGTTVENGYNSAITTNQHSVSSSAFNSDSMLKQMSTEPTVDSKLLSVVRNQQQCNTTLSKQTSTNTKKKIITLKKLNAFISPLKINPTSTVHDILQPNVLLHNTQQIQCNNNQQQQETHKPISINLTSPNTPSSHVIKPLQHNHSTSSISLSYNWSHGNQLFRNSYNHDNVDVLEVIPTTQHNNVELLSNNQPVHDSLYDNNKNIFVNNNNIINNNNVINHNNIKSGSNIININCSTTNRTNQLIASSCNKTLEANIRLQIGNMIEKTFLDDIDMQTSPMEEHSMPSTMPSTSVTTSTITTTSMPTINRSSSPDMYCVGDDSTFHHNQITYTTNQCVVNQNIKNINRHVNVTNNVNNLYYDNNVDGNDDDDDDDDNIHEYDTTLMDDKENIVMSSHAKSNATTFMDDICINSDDDDNEDFQVKPALSSIKKKCHSNWKKRFSSGNKKKLKCRKTLNDDENFIQFN